MSALQRILDRARERAERIVFPEACDPRVLGAVHRLAAERIVEPVLVGEPGSVRDAARELGIVLGNVAVLDPSQSEHHDACASIVRNSFRKRKPDDARVERMLRDPLLYESLL